MQHSTADSKRLSPKEVAGHLGLSVDSVYALINRGELGATNCASSTAGRPIWRITPADLADFDRRRRNVATPTTPVRARPRRLGAAPEHV